MLATNRLSHFHWQPLRSTALVASQLINRNHQQVSYTEWHETAQPLSIHVNQGLSHLAHTFHNLRYKHTGPQSLTHAAGTWLDAMEDARHVNSTQAAEGSAKTRDSPPIAVSERVVCENPVCWCSLSEPKKRCNGIKCSHHKPWRCGAMTAACHIHITQPHTNNHNSLHVLPWPELVSRATTACLPHTAALAATCNQVN